MTGASSFQFKLFEQAIHCGARCTEHTLGSAFDVAGAPFRIGPRQRLNPSANGVLGLPKFRCFTATLQIPSGHETADATA